MYTPQCLARKLILLPTASVGSRALKDYLTFAETSRLPTEIETGRSAESPFESDVEAALLQRSFESVKQLGVAGFFWI